MRTKSLIEMSKCRLREFCREPSAVFFVIMMPIVWMILLGLAFSNPKKEHYSIGIDQKLKEKTDLSEQHVLNALEESPYLNVIYGEIETLKSLMRKNTIALAVSSTNYGYEYLADNSNPEAIYGKRLVNDVIQSSLGRKDVIAATEKTLIMPGGRYIDFLIPGLLALSFLTTSLFGTGMTIVANRRENLLKRYLTTPMKASDYILSHLIGRMLILCIEMLGVLGAGYALFGFRIAGSLFDFFALSLLGTGAFTVLAILAGSRTKNTSAYNGFVNLMVLPMMILSGVWFSKSHFPDWLNQICNFLPLNALLDGLRQIALDGTSLKALSWESLILLCYIFLGGGFASRIFKWH